MRPGAVRLAVRVSSMLVLLAAIPAWMAFEGIPPGRLLEGWFWGNVAEALKTLGAAPFIGVTLAAIAAFVVRRLLGRKPPKAEAGESAPTARRVAVATRLAARGEPALAIARQTGYARDAVRSITGTD